MIEWFAAFWVSYVLSWPALCFIFGMCLFSEFNDVVPLSCIFGALSIIIVLQLVDVPEDTVKYALFSYIPIGMVWAIWRWRRHCADEVALYLERRSRSGAHFHNKDAVHNSLSSMSVVYHKDRIVGWIVTWPWGLLIHLTRDMVVFLEQMITVYFRKLFDMVSASSREEMLSYKEGLEDEDEGR